MSKTHRAFNRHRKREDADSGCCRWTWYAVTWAVVIARMTSRRVLFGSFKKLQTDDALMLFAMMTDTVLMACMTILSHTPSNLIDPNDHTVLTPEDIQERVLGSKMVLVVEQMQILTIWAIKGCLLILYGRLTMSLKQNIAVKIVSVYVVLGFVVMEILYLGVWCRPFNQYWAVPPNSTQCSAATNHLILNAVLNISSDIMIILIPMPVFLQVQLPPKRKAILCCIFALGIFTILSAILNKYYSFTEPFGASWTFWYIRESSTAILTANLPLTWTLLQRIFNIRSFNARYTNQRMSEARSRLRSIYVNQRSVSTRHCESEITRSESQEEINKTYGVPLKIYRQHEVRITSEAGDVEAGPAGRSPDIPIGPVSNGTVDTTCEHTSTDSN
ncbi:hypothetical protein F4779DRAFT_49335 [Xylariaceae sp. FL0662B]|nr:hypothetical protein F4779DRAFT_49335 [Xylariaceae sp. FL0662B]